jgi:hypothetical protein
MAIEPIVPDNEILIRTKPTHPDLIVSRNVGWDLGVGFIQRPSVNVKGAVAPRDGFGW